VDGSVDIAMSCICICTRTLYYESRRAGNERPSE